MSKPLAYKGYSARIEFDPEDRIFFGRVAGVRDIITFHGESVDDLVAAFEEAVDDYLLTCEKLGQPPNKPYSGKLMLRLPEAVHAAVATAAEVSGKSINQWASEALAQAART